MTDATKRTVRAFAIAPLVVPLLWAMAAGLNWRQGPVYVLGEFGLVLISSLPFLYGATLLVAVPTYVLIRRRWQLRVWHPVMFGALIGAVVLPMTESLPDGQSRYGFGSLIGAASGILFWILWRPRGLT